MMSCSELRGKYINIAGEVLAKPDCTEKEYKLFNEMKFQEDTILEYKGYLHPGKSLYEIENKIYIYYIPADIYSYIEYKNGNISIINEPPEELYQKTVDCLRYMEVDFNYIFKIKKANFISRKLMSYRIRKPLIIIRRSKDDRISFDETYMSIKEIPYIKNFDDNAKIKEYYVNEKGYRK